jgi:NLI interacting factor-like phosphatase.
MQKLVLSTLGHTWLLDLDGTIVKHNGYKTDGEDSLLPGVEVFLQSIPEKDMIIFITSRNEKYKEQTISFLEGHHIRFDHIIFNAPYGERILVSDKKPSGLSMSIAIDCERDSSCKISFREDNKL